MIGRLRLRSLSIKLALVLFLIVVTAMGIVYAVLVPRLETRLVDAKINDLARAQAPVEVGIARTMPYPQDAVEFFAASFNARIVVFGPLGSSGSRVIADSNRLDSSDTENDPVARRARASGALESGRIGRDRGQFAEVAFPLPRSRGTVVLLSASLHDALANVRLVRRSVIVAGVVALLASLLVGSLAAWRFTRRIRRLEAAAERLARGDFGTPIADPGEDEVGQLARAFEHMRSRLAQLDHARREFIANASHELRTPIFSLGGFLELFADEELDEETRREFLAEMRGQVDRMTRLATDLLDLSRLDAGQLALETTELDLASIAATLVDEFRPVAELAGHDVRSEAEVPVYALADAQRVLRVGRALVENALRHTPAGTVVTIVAAEAAGQATLAVHDEGPGIAESDRDHLFQRFYRGGSAVHASGSGLGLAIAHELAELMHGSIDVTSGARGTVFTLVLPPATAAFSRRNAERPALRQPAGA